MVYGYIYKIPFLNGKCYIGLSTLPLEERRKKHKYLTKSGDTRCLYNALRKYNMTDTFQLIQIDTAESREELCEKEVAYISMYNSYYEDGYNMTKGGEGIDGHLYTEESKLKMSKSAKKRTSTEEWKRSHHDSMTKHWKNLENRKKMSVLKKESYKHPTVRENLRKGAIKRFENPIERMNRSISAKKQFENPESIKKILDRKGKNKPFNVFEKDGIFIKSFNYQFEANIYLRKTYNINKDIRICEVLNGKRKTAHGFVFKYTE